MMERYERAIRSNMASAEKDLTKPEDKRGFVIGAVLKLWEEYQAKRLSERQFDRLITLLSTCFKGEYKNFIADQVRDYKSGNPPTIVGY